MNLTLLSDHHPQRFLPLSSSTLGSVSLSPSTHFFRYNGVVSAAPISLAAPTSRQAFMATNHRDFSRTRADVNGVDDLATDLEDLASHSVVYQKTLRLVECSMFAAVAGLTYLLSSSLAIENYFGCFFSFPIVLSSLRWGIAAGRKTMVATSVLLFVLSGPVKSLTYLLLHGLVGFTMGSLWRLRTCWSLSVALCSLIRACGAIGYILTSSFLLRENFLALITNNIHAGLTFLLNGVGINSVPSMNLVYAIFGTLLVLNCGFFLFLLHILYAVFIARLGMRSSLSPPKWLEKTLL